MRSISRAALVLGLALALPTVARAQAAHPDYSGSWSLDPAQSDAGQMMPSKLEMRIAQSASEVVIDRVQVNQMGESTVKLRYALEGPSTNEIVIGGNAVKVTTVVSWAAGSPVFKSSLKFGDNDVEQTDKWTLADGGKKLTIDRSFDAGGQSMAAKLVLVKKP